MVNKTVVNPYNWTTSRSDPVSHDVTPTHDVTLTDDVTLNNNVTLPTSDDYDVMFDGLHPARNYSLDAFIETAEAESGKISHLLTTQSSGICC